MALIITGTFIQFLCLAVQVIQLRLGRPPDPGPRRPVPVGGRTAPDHGETARAALSSNARTPQATDTVVTPSYAAPQPGSLRARPQDTPETG
jgi:hypothetical protein